jgi:hypothetical protein
MQRKFYARRNWRTWPGYENDELNALFDSREKLTVRCSRCRWHYSGLKPTALRKQKEHRVKHED